MKLGVNQFCWPMSWSVEEVLRSAAKLGYERMEICFTAADGAAPGGGLGEGSNHGFVLAVPVGKQPDAKKHQSCSDGTEKDKF